MTARTDTSIRGYQRKRDFAASGEPLPENASVRPKAPIFVVQKHRAHRAGLHWDFRLEHNGVLWSWAVRKGPSLDSFHKRIAAHVEDHLLAYADFQGTIPDGHYGAGTVEAWDRGTWTPLIDPDEGMRDGEIKFILTGTRLHGKFTLVRLKSKSGEERNHDNWLLIKGHDAAEETGADVTLLEERIAAPSPPKADGTGCQSIPGAVRAVIPDRHEPQLASIADAPPKGAGWLTEVKFDGYRLIARRDHGTITLHTRNGHDWTDRLPAVAESIGALAADTIVLDGELVALDKDGVSSFPRLQAALTAGHDRILCFIFSICFTWTAGICGRAR